MKLHFGQLPIFGTKAIAGAKTIEYSTKEKQPDGSIIVTLIKDGEDKIYRFKVKNPYEENEEVLEHEAVDIRTPKYILDRIEEAKKEKNK